VACAQQDSPAPQSVEPAIEVEPLQPVEGVWSVDSRSVLRDECGGLLGEDAEDNSDTMDLLVWDDEAFTIGFAFDDGEEFEVDCLREDRTFTCDGTLDVYEISDTVLSLTWTGGGEFTAETALSATLDATASCKGSLCDVAEDFLETALPCDGTMALDASFLEQFAEEG